MVVVKDMSRFGRDYLQVGMYTEVLFPEKDIHFVAINDGVDSEKGDNDFTPLRNLFNEWYARDTSKKTRAVVKAKGMSGKRLSHLPPYGYIMGEDDKWVIDEETGPVVKEIFALCGEGAVLPVFFCKTKTYGAGLVLFGSPVPKHALKVHWKSLSE